MPTFRKLGIGLLSTVFVAAWVFFTPPGRRGLERLGVYTECAIDVWSPRKHCNTHQTVNADEPAASPAPSAAGPSAAERPPPLRPSTTVATPGQTRDIAPTAKLASPVAVGGSPGGTTASHGPTVSLTSAQNRAAPKHTQTYWTARHGNPD